MYDTVRGRTAKRSQNWTLRSALVLNQKRHPLIVQHKYLKAHGTQIVSLREQCAFLTVAISREHWTSMGFTIREHIFSKMEANGKVPIVIAAWLGKEYSLIQQEDAGVA